MGFSLCIPLPHSLSLYLSKVFCLLLSFLLHFLVTRAREGKVRAEPHGHVFVFGSSLNNLPYSGYIIQCVACSCLCLVHVQGCFHQGNLSSIMLKMDNGRGNFDKSTGENPFWSTWEKCIKGSGLWLASFGWSNVSLSVFKESLITKCQSVLTQI